MNIVNDIKENLTHKSETNLAGGTGGMGLLGDVSHLFEAPHRTYYLVSPELATVLRICNQTVNNNVWHVVRT